MGEKEILQSISTQSHLMEQHLWTSTLVFCFFFNFNWDRIHFSHPQESRAPSQVTGTWKMNANTLNIPSFFFYPSLTSWAWCHMGWDIYVLSWDQLSWLCHLPNLCSPQLPLRKGIRGLDTATTAQQQQKYLCIIKPVCFQCNSQSYSWILWRKLIPPQPKTAQVISWVLLAPKGEIFSPTVHIQLILIKSEINFICVGLGCFDYLSAPKLGFSVQENCHAVLFYAQTEHTAPIPTGCIHSQGALVVRRQLYKTTLQS